MRGTSFGVAACAVLAAAVARAEPAPCETGDAERCAPLCDRGNASACGVLGHMYANGKGVKADPAKGIALLDRACAGGSRRACLNRAFLDEQGVGVPRDEKRALAVYKRACEADQDQYGCVRLASIYLMGHVVPADPARAAALIKQACEAGEASGCLNLAMMTEQGQGVPRDADQAVKLYTRACEGGNGTACAGLANVFDVGRGMPKDPERARRYYGQACDHFVFAACTRLGALLEGGVGGDKDLGGARTAYQRACAHGEATGCKTLERSRTAAAPPQSEADCAGRTGMSQANCYSDLGFQLSKSGSDSEETGDKIATLYLKACQLGSPYGCGNLGSELFVGKRVRRDVPKALELLHKVCNEDHLKTTCDYIRSLPEWAHDPSTFPPPWAKDGPVAIEGAGCDGVRTAVRDQTRAHIPDGDTASARALTRLKIARRPETIDPRLWSACIKLVRQDVESHRAETDQAGDGVHSTGWMKNSHRGGGGGSGGSNTAARMHCRVDCAGMCRARSPGDPCQVSIRNCERSCDQQYP